MLHLRQRRVCCICGSSVCCIGGCRGSARGIVAGLDTDDELSCCRGFDGAAFASAFAFAFAAASTATDARAAMAVFAFVTAFAAFAAAVTSSVSSSAFSSSDEAQPDTASASTYCSS